MKLITWDQLREKLGPAAPCQRTIRRMISRGEFVRPVMLSPRREAFIEHEVDQWIQANRKPIEGAA